MDELVGYLMIFIAILIIIGGIIMAIGWVLINIVWPIVLVVLTVALWAGGGLLGIGLLILCTIAIAGMASALAVGIKRTGDLVREAHRMLPR